MNAPAIRHVLQLQMGIASVHPSYDVRFSGRRCRLSQRPESEQSLLPLRAGVHHRQCGHVDNAPHRG